MTDVSYLAIAPEMLLLVGAVAVLMVDVFAHPRPRVHGWIAAATFVAVAVAVGAQWHRIGIDGVGTSFGGTLFLHHLSVSARTILLVVAVLGTATAWDMLVGLGRRLAEGLSLVMVSTAGFMLMGASADLVMVFVALEIGSIALYVLAGIVRTSRAGDEAAMKYFLLGAFASAIFIYGGALAYAGTGTTNIVEAGVALSSYHVGRPAVILIGMALLVVGMGFKITAAPFHSWAPDVYQGAPAGVVGFMAAAAKVGGFAALVNILVIGFDRYRGAWADGLALLAALSVVTGTLLAIQQSDVRRMLAYSGVAHAGFILTGVTAGLVGTAGVLFYLATYSVMLLGAFAAVTVVSGPASSGSGFDEYRGLGRRSPLVAAVLATLMIAMSGMPLTTGFVGKFQVLSSAWDGGYRWLVIVGLVTSVAAFFFYLRLVVLMYFRQGDQTRDRPSLSGQTRLVLLLSAAATVVFGVFPSPLLGWLTRAGG